MTAAPTSTRQETPALVLLHGFPLAAAMWEGQVAGLATAGWRVLAPDLPGFGGNGEPPPATGMDGYGDAVAAWLDRQRIETAVVAGMSMGGYVLLNLLARYPQRLRGAIFVASRAEADEPAARERRTQLAAAARAGRAAEIIDGFAALLFAPGTPEQRPELVTRVRGWMEQATPAGLEAALLAMRDRPDYSGRLAQFTLPALVVGGAADRLLPASSFEVLARGLPAAEGEVIEGGGHLVNLERPEAFNACLRRFLVRLST